jgi:ribosomal protein S12 methylthiotransferase
MKINTNSTRPDIARPQLRNYSSVNTAPQIGLISLGCPKALVDSERILTRLQNEGYSITGNYEGADAVIVNTCGFLDSAKAESLETINEALKKNGKVIVTGCLGVKSSEIKKQFPSLLNISGPQQYQKVVDAVHQAVPPIENKFLNLIPKTNVKLTPSHYSYLKISEGCNHKCKFCIIPDMRGKLISRSPINILREAERLYESGVKEILVISQDTSAYGVDKKHEVLENGDTYLKTHIVELAEALGSLGMWIRLHYVYPYPHVRKLIPLMAKKIILPYLDIPFQHSHPDVLKRMSRPANQVKALKEIETWRGICPDITIRSSFIVGFPGETESEFNHLLQWLQEAQLDRIGCFKYEDVEGAQSNILENQCSPEVKHDRWQRLMKTAQEISAAKLCAKVGSTQDVIVDQVDKDGAICRTKGDAPEIDGNLFIDSNFKDLKQGDILSVTVEESSEYDLWGSPTFS